MLEKRGLEEEGLYRVVGVASKVIKLLNSGLDRRKLEKLNLGTHLLLYVEGGNFLLIQYDQICRFCIDPILFND